MRSRAFARTRRGEAQPWFHCVHCKQPVTSEPLGSAHRNHCNWCLWSRHLDNTPGDRAAECGAAMEPIAVWVRRDGEWAIIHRCRGCGELHSNRIAGDDDEHTLILLASRPLSQPAFPLDGLAIPGAPLPED